jgi:hypothetical protein
MEQADVVRFTLDALEELGVEYAIVGSFASIAYGEPRLTRDIDILVVLPPERVSDLCRRYPPPDWYVSEPAARQAVRARRQFNVIHTLSGNKVDFLIARDDEWGRLQMSRRQQVAVLAGRLGYAAHPEDVILGKLLYYKEGGSEKHLRDIAGILTVSGELVDRGRVRAWAEKLAVVDIWDEIVRRVVKP